MVPIAEFFNHHNSGVYYEEDVDDNTIDIKEDIDEIETSDNSNFSSDESEDDEYDYSKYTLRSKVCY